MAGNSKSNDGDITGYHGEADSSDYWIVKLDAMGNIEWEQSLGGIDHEKAYDIIQTSDGYYVIAGYSISPDGDVTVNKGANDMWIVKLISNRDAVPVCIVTVDSTSTKNVIVWEKPITTDIDSFRIYRDITNIYTHIGSVPYNALSIFVDTTNGVNPQITAYRYKLSTIDMCGNESALSDSSKTMYLQVSPGSPAPAINLSWDDYVGFTIAWYRILRDSTGMGNFDSIYSVGSGILSWTDLAPPANARYIVEVVPPDVCTATKKAEDYNSSRSNTSTSATGINEFKEQVLKFIQILRVA